jgi:hypothetical protein
VHVACPCIDAGPAHAVVHEPQCAGCVGSTQAPLQLSGVELSASQPTPHLPAEHVGDPTPASGPSHTLLHVPQCDGSVGSTQTPLHWSVVGAGHPASCASMPGPSV